jgi:hypothetical protein
MRKPSTPIPCAQYEASKEESDDYEGDEFEGDMHDNNIGGVEAYYMQEDMHSDTIYSRCCASNSDDDGPHEDVDEEGFTDREAKALNKVVGQVHGIPLFCDLN